MMSAAQTPSVRRVELGVGCVVAVERGDVDDRVAPGDDALEPRAVEEIDAPVLDLGSTLPQLPGDVTSDEAGRAGEVDLQAARARRNRPSARTGQTSR